MSKKDYKHLRNELRPFFTLLLVVASSLFLASCGGGSGAIEEQATVASEDGRREALAVPAAWKGRVPINTAGNIPFASTKLDAESLLRPPSKVNGYVVNQYWIASSTLTATEIISKLKDYPLLVPIASRTGQVLIEMKNERDTSTLSQLDMVKKELWADEIYHRMVIGEDAHNGVMYTDTGDGPIISNNNWHLDAVRIPAAWNLLGDSGTTIHVGVADNGLYGQHEDLIGQVPVNLSTKQEYHGTGVVGTIAAIKGNGKGISGLSSNSTISFNAVDMMDPVAAAEGLEALLKADSKIRVVNCSWGFSSREDLGRDPTIEDAILRTRPFRALAGRHPNVLFVYSAGNDGRSALTQNGAIHLDSAGSDSPKKNVIVVAASLADNRLAGYSAFGRFAEVAAPTEFKSTRSVFSNESTYYAIPVGYSYGTSYSGYWAKNETGYTCVSCAFGGTSAAAPIVTAIAALAFSSNAQLSPEQVKKLLTATNTTTTWITERHICVGIQCDAIESLPNPVPQIDAEAVVRNAIALKNLSVLLSHYAFDSTLNDSVIPRLPILLVGATSPLYTTRGTSPAISLPGGEYLANSNGLLVPFMKADGNHSFSVATWVKLDAFAPATNAIVYERQINGDDGGYNAYGISNYLDGGKRKWLFLLSTVNDAGTPTLEALFSTTEGVLGRWYHLAATYDQATGWARLYVDGQVAVEKIIGKRLNLPPNPYLTVGHQPWGADQAIRGAVDDLRFYRGALTQSDVQALIASTASN